MPETPDILKDLEKTARRFEREGRKALKRFNRERRKLERQVDRQRKQLVQQVDDLLQRANTEIRKQVETVQDMLPVATKRDLAKVDKKLARMRRQLADLEKRAA